MISVPDGDAENVGGKDEPGHLAQAAMRASPQEARRKDASALECITTPSGRQAGPQPELAGSPPNARGNGTRCINAPVRGSGGVTSNKLKTIELETCSLP